MRRLQRSKKRHEVSKFLREHHRLFQEHNAITGRMDDATTAIRDDGVGEFYIPSRAIFERITPLSEPVGLVFADGSFLVVKQIFEYGYPDDSATEPQIYFREYGYHYQRPENQTFFRYDYHPDVGSAETHPLYHLHATGWQEGATDLPQVPRFPTSSVTLEEVLELIRVNFFL